MLRALISRGVSFELRFSAGPAGKRRWSAAFHYGSVVATLAQGIVLGAFVQGFAVEGRRFVGGAFDWLTRFCLLTAIGLVCGYALLGATWLLIKTDGMLQLWARRQAVWLTAGVLAAMAAVSLWTPFLDPRIAQRWFAWPNIVLLSPVPIVTAAIAWRVWLALQPGARVPAFFPPVGAFRVGYA